MLKFDPATQSSQVSLLKDIVGVDTLAKFSRQNLNEIKGLGFCYKGLKDGIFKATGTQLNQEALKKPKFNDKFTSSFNKT